MKIQTKEELDQYLLINKDKIGKAKNCDEIRVILTEQNKVLTEWVKRNFK